MTENQNTEQNSYLRGIIEALLFVNEKPVTLEQIKKVMDTVTASDIKKTIQELKSEYEQKQSGIAIMEIAEGYQMLTNPQYVSYVRSFYQTKHKEKLSKPGLECLAIIAYKQPVTRLDIELIRGVNSDGVVNNLLEKELIKVVGRKDIPGKPYLYGTTKQFMEYFGLKSLENLPKLEEFPNLQPVQDILPVEDSEIQEGTEKVESKEAVIETLAESSGSNSQEQEVQLEGSGASASSVEQSVTEENK